MIQIQKIINTDVFKNLCLIVCIIALLYLILIRYDSDDTETFSDNLNLLGNNIDFEYSAGLIYKRIRKITSEKIKDSIIEKADAKDTNINEFKVNHINVPIGVIRFFPFKLTKEYDSWLLCDGGSLLGKNYPELFRLINNRDPDPNGEEEFNVPDLRGRMIFGRRFNRAYAGSPDLSTLGGSDGKFMNASNKNKFMELNLDEMDNGIEKNQLQDLGVPNALNKLAIGGSASITYRNLGTDGIDGCPEDNISETIVGNSSDDIEVCVDIVDNQEIKLKSNMPPYISLYPYIKASTIKYKYTMGKPK
jgi:microcystin-dependent protein